MRTIGAFEVRIAIVLLLMSCGMQSAGAGDPISLHPDNGHYFLWRNEATILITSGEHYGALLNLDFDYERYFKALAADKLNHTRIFAGTYCEIPGSFGITDNTLAPKPGRYSCPWARSGAGNSGKFDLRKWNPAYFARLKKLMAAADKAGIVVEMTLFCPFYRDDMWKVCPMNAANNVNGVGKCRRTEALTLKHEPLVEFQTAFVRKIVAELNQFDNLYFEVCNEPYFAGVTSQWQHRIVDTIISTEAKLTKKHLVSMNIANGKKKVVKPHRGVSIFNFHYCVPPETVAMNYGLGKVIGENETGFRGRHDFLYRSEGWDFLIAGGGLYNNLDYSFTPKHPGGTFLKYKSPGGGSPSLRKQLRVLKEFLYSFDFVRMKPDNSVVKSVSDGLSVRVLARRGGQYAIYMHVPLPKKPRKISDYLKDRVKATLVLDIPAGRYRAQWIDVKTGKTLQTRKLAHKGGKITLESPEFANDAALRIVRGD